MNAFLKMITEICEEENIALDVFSDDWILRLKKDNRDIFLSGRHSALNSSTSASIADDKVSTYALLSNNNIPAIPHYLIRKEESLSEITSKISQYSSPLVIKPCCGSRGRDVYLCKTTEESLKNITKLLKKYDSVCISPFFDAKCEYRCFFLDNKIHFIYKKTKSGDSLFFNLCNGGKPSLIDQAEEKSRTIAEIATKAANSIGIRFAAIDILESKTGILKVLEINEAPSTTHLIKALPETYETIKDIYRQAIRKM
ncbi:MAG: hypothetical protein MJZ22_00920 [Candidatus Saccharibacteria bacterium]|nr:hypothetical protein [Candidatus Saccharibacteria bacterium]